VVLIGDAKQLIGRHTGSGKSETLGYRLTSSRAYFWFLTQPRSSLERSICSNHQKKSAGNSVHHTRYDRSRRTSHVADDSSSMRRLPLEDEGQ
jgi:hypothetical protein